MRKTQDRRDSAKEPLPMENLRGMTSLHVELSKSIVLTVLLVLFAGLPHAAAVVHAQTKTPAGASPKAEAKVSASTQAPAVTQSKFPTPEAAMQSLAEAVKAKDHVALLNIFGSEGDKLFSGDAVEDNKDLEDFASAIQESARLQKADENKYTLRVGKNDWPTPIPIVKRGGAWQFDTQAGIEEVLNRRIGENELSAISTCRAYVLAQWEYFTAGHWDRDAVAAYAQKFISSPGQHDGLYWEVAEGEEPSPLGQLMAAARTEGYQPGRRSSRQEGVKLERHPYHGYYFKILTQQGASAPGGKYDYIINGNMIAGYALVAYPDKWGNSGVMTFIVNQQGRVYEKNLGADTAKVASEMTEYNPDTSWKLVQP